MKNILNAQIFLQKSERLFENNILPLPPIWYKICKYINKNRFEYEN